MRAQRRGRVPAPGRGQRPRLGDSRCPLAPKPSGRPRGARPGAPAGMSRRKQRKPQQLISDCDGSTASENGDTGDEAAPSCPTELAAHRDTCHPNQPPPSSSSSSANGQDSAGSSSSSSSSSSSEPRPDSPPGMETETAPLASNPLAPDPPPPPPPPPLAPPAAPPTLGTSTSP
ncbi:unnamed protein product [Natator depressus]